MRVKMVVRIHMSEQHNPSHPGDRSARGANEMQLRGLLRTRAWGNNNKSNYFPCSVWISPTCFILMKSACCCLQSGIKTSLLIGVSGTDAGRFAKSERLTVKPSFCLCVARRFTVVFYCRIVRISFCLSAPCTPPSLGTQPSFRHAFYQVSHSPGYANAALVLTQSGCVLCLHGLAHNKCGPFTDARTRTAIVSHKLSTPIPRLVIPKPEAVFKSTARRDLKLKRRVDWLKIFHPVRNSAW